jgi:hypothetical protein
MLFYIVVDEGASCCIIASEQGPAEDRLFARNRDCIRIVPIILYYVISCYITLWAAKHVTHIMAMHAMFCHVPETVTLCYETVMRCFATETAAQHSVASHCSMSRRIGRGHFGWRRRFRHIIFYQIRYILLYNGLSKNVDATLWRPLSSLVRRRAVLPHSDGEENRSASGAILFSGEMCCGGSPQAVLCCVISFYIKFYHIILCHYFLYYEWCLATSDMVSLSGFCS